MTGVQTCALPIWGTEDVDVVPSPDADNLLRLGNALVSLDAHLLLGDQHDFGPGEHDALARGANLSLQTRHGPIDVVQRVPGLPRFAELEARAIDVAAFGVPLRVISRADLIAAKRARAAARDIADIEALEASTES